MDALRGTRAHPTDPKTAVRPLVVVSVLYIVLNVLFVSLRFISRRYVKRTKLGWDDWLIIPAFVFNIIGCVLGLVIAHYLSKGNAPADIPVFMPKQIKTILEPTLRNGYIFVFFEVLGLTFPKLSICALYLRLFTGKITRAVTWIVIGFTIAMGISYAFAGLFICDPAPFFWNKLIAGGHCNNLNTYFRSFGLPNIIIDVGIITIPIPVIWNLQMPTGKKLGLTVIFLTGIFTIVVSGIRWAIFQEYDINRISPSATTPLIFINIIECSTYLIAACLPASYPIATRLVPPTLRQKLDRIFTPRGARLGKNITNDYWSTNRTHNRSRGSGDTHLLPLAHTYMRPYSPHAEGKASRVLGGGTEHAGLDRIARQMGLEHGSELKNGNVVIKTEIEVTQEERIDRVLGL